VLQIVHLPTMNDDSNQLCYPFSLLMNSALEFVATMEENFNFYNVCMKQTSTNPSTVYNHAPFSCCRISRPTNTSTMGKTLSFNVSRAPKGQHKPASRPILRTGLI